MKRILLLGFLFILVTSVIVSCQKELSYENNQDIALGSLHDSADECFTALVANGTYYNGVSAARDTNFVSLVVNVTQTGSYIISTNTINGFYFTDSGYFTKTGMDTIMLKAMGTPILNTTTDFTVTFDSTSCGFTVVVQDSTGTGLGGEQAGGGTGTGGSAYTDPNAAKAGTFHFTDVTNNNQTYSGAVVYGTVDPMGNLVISGNNTTKVFGVTMKLPSSTVTKGSYLLTDVGGDIFYGSPSTTSPVFDYDADGSTSKEATDPSYFNITNYNSSTKELSASFYCWADDANGNPALIQGSLSVVLQ